jgi:pyruvate/2-oxoglutarate/acetoin dehydrogenase E1 component/TPP-dependent pyruvate/acetoin dehydrogenase alpha subunit
MQLNTESIQITKQSILDDYKWAVASRQASLLGRKEVFMGKAKFGIFGDGKELPQLAMAKAFQNGDFRSGYYRDQTFMFAIGQLTLQQYFAQLYAHTNLEAEPATGGRLMNGHFATRMLDENGHWKDLTTQKNSSADISPTAGQMPRLLGMAYASKLFRNNPELHNMTTFSHYGNEVAWGTIGNASTSEGMFFETLNAAGVLQVPMVISVWDDEYGISVPKEYHTTKGSISAILAGLQRNDENKGFEIIRVEGWNYEALIDAYSRASEYARNEHCPVLVHVIELTQPQGHSTSGSHERYKSAERLSWEQDWDCNLKFRQYLVENNIASEDELSQLDNDALNEAKNARDAAWKSFQAEILTSHKEALDLLDGAIKNSFEGHVLQAMKDNLSAISAPILSDSVKAIRSAIRQLRNEGNTAIAMRSWLTRTLGESALKFNSHIYSQSSDSPLLVHEVKPCYNENSQIVDGREVVRACFDAMFQRDARVFAFGEDVGKIGDVNQGFAGMQEKYGELRVTDTGIRECTIAGQGIGTALRGLRPIAEIQYLDYLLYAIQILSDDLACLQYRTVGGQKAPLIIRTRGHRLEGVWHAGSPISMILSSVRGMHLLTPRNMTQAAGFYNTLLKGDDPAIVIECLNGYRLKEKMPDNIGEICLPLGQVEMLKEGTDITLVTYGSMCRIVLDAATVLEGLGISIEVIDAQSLLPFDTNHDIVKSLAKTNRIIFADEDIPGGASAYLMQEVLEKQGGYKFLDSAPITVSAKAHRPAYSSDGDYFSKPSVDDVVDAAYALMNEVSPATFKDYYNS